MKVRLTGATFDASAKTVTHTSFSDVTLAGIQLIVNVTDQVIIYNFADSSKGGTLATDTLTLEYDTTSMSDTDELMILVEDGVTSQTVTATDLDIRNLTNTDVVTAELSATDNAVLDAIAASVAAIDTDATTIIGHVDGLETLVTSTNTKLDTVNTNLGTIDGRVDGLETSNSAIQTAVQLIDDAIVADDAAFTPATTKVMMAGFEYDDTTPDTVNEGDAGAARMSSRREVYTQLRDAAGNERGANVDASNRLQVLDGNSASALTALQLIDDTVFADDAGVTLGTSKGNVMAGVSVQTDGTDPTAVSAEGDASAVRTDMNRLLIVNQTHPRFWHVSADYASAQTNTSVKAAPGASLSLYITDLQISNGATAGNITLLDGSGGTVLYELYPAVNGGATLSLRSPIKLTANTALCITSATVTTHSIFVSGYIAP